MKTASHNVRFDSLGRLQHAAPAVQGAHNFDRTLFAEDLAELLQAGLSVREALSTISQSMPSAADRACVIRVQERIVAGSSLSGAMAEEDVAFGGVLVALVRAGEQTSALPESLARHARTSRRLERTRASVTTALVYPATVLVAGLTVLTFLLGWVLPRFSDVLQDSSESLSPLARTVILAGSWLAAHRPWWVGALVTAVGMAALLASTPGGRRRIQSLVARLPGLSATVRLLHAGRFFSNVATLTQGGLNAVASLELAAPLLLPDGQAHVLRAISRMQRGQPLAASLGGDVFGDPVVGRLLEVGQRTGELPRTLERISLLLEARINRRVARLSRAVEPLLTVILGILISAIVLLMYVPLLELSAGLL